MPIIDSATASIFDQRPVNGAPEVNAGAARDGNPASATRQPSFAEVAAQVANDTSRAVAEKVSSPLSSFKFWEKDSLSFGDVIDIVNPLQHLPIVSTFYRNLTGDQIGAVPRLVGGALWGRVGGFVAGVVNSVVEWFTGKDVGDHLYAAFFGPPKTPPAALAASIPAVPAATPNATAAVAASDGETLLIANPPAQLVPVQEQAIVESTLRSSEESQNAVPETSESKEVPAIEVVPWSAASALHIFQSHDRSLKDNEDAPVLRYIA